MKKPRASTPKLPRPRPAASLAQVRGGINDDGLGNSYIKSIGGGDISA